MRVLVLSDIHANLPALETVLADAARRGYDEVWCLGDLVGYGPDPNACVERLRALGPQLGACLAGNHDYAALGKGIDINDFNPEAKRAVLWTRAQLKPDVRSYLDALPGIPVRRGQFFLAHGSPRDSVWEYISSARIARENFDAVPDFTICLVGHTHVPAIFRYALGPREGAVHSPTTQDRIHPEDRPLLLDDTTHRIIVNPGSVGQPRDHDPRTSYAILDTGTCEWWHVRLEYPIEETQHRMLAAKLPERLITRLSYGW